MKNRTDEFLMLQEGDATFAMPAQAAGAARLRFADLLRAEDGVGRDLIGMLDRNR